MRQGGEHQINAGKVDVFHLDQRGQVQMAQMREHIGHLLAGLAVGGQGRNPQMRMGGDQADKFGTGIARGAQNGDVIGHDGPLLCSGKRDLAAQELRGARRYTGRIAGGQKGAVAAGADHFGAAGQVIGQTFSDQIGL